MHKKINKKNSLKTILVSNLVSKRNNKKIFRVSVGSFLLRFFYAPQDPIAADSLQSITADGFHFNHQKRKECNRYVECNQYGFRQTI
jgi:hypothetical protein